MRNRSLQHLRQRFSDLDSERSSWEVTHRAIQEHVLPRRGRFLHDEANDGRRRGTRMLDSTALQACDRGASGLLSGLSSQSQQWVRDALADIDDEPHDAREWLDRLTAVKMAIFEDSGIYAAFHEIYRECMAFGTAAYTIYPDFNSVIRVMPRTCGEYWLEADHVGDITAMFCKSRLYVSQIVREYGLTEETAPPVIAEAMRNDRMRMQLDVIECYAENENPDERGQPLAQRGKDFICDVYLEAGGAASGTRTDANDDRNFLKRTGSAHRNFGAVRWARLGRDAYGRGPGMDALGDAAALQAMQRDKLRGIEYQVKPPLQGPAWLDDRTADLRPGAYNPRSMSDRDDTVSSLWDVRIDLAHLREEIMQTQERIRQAFYNDVLATFLTDPRSAKTATEVAEMSSEKLTLFAPIAGRFVRELLIPINEAVIARMGEAGMFDEEGAVGVRPDSIQGRELKFEFMGVLAQAQKSVMLSQVERFAGFVTNFAQIDPAVMDRIDSDELIEEVRDLIGAPARITRSLEEAEAMRKQRAQQQEMMQAAEMAQKAGSAAKSLGDAKVGMNGEQPVGALEALVGGGMQ